MTLGTSGSEIVARKAVEALIWITYRIEMHGITELLGGMPKKVDLIEGQMSSKEVRLRAKATWRDPERIIAENIAAMGLEPGIEAETDAEQMSCGFRSHNGDLCLGSHQIGALLLDCATTTKMSRKVFGLVDLLNRGIVSWQDGCPEHGSLCPFLLLGVQAPTGVLEWGHQVKDRAGSRAILRRYDYVHPWSLSCNVKYLDTGVMTAQVWDNLWGIAGIQGLGAARPRNYGRFSVKYERVPSR